MHSRRVGDLKVAREASVYFGLMNSSICPLVDASVATYLGKSNMSPLMLRGEGRGATRGCTVAMHGGNARWHACPGRERSRSARWRRPQRGRSRVAVARAGCTRRYTPEYIWLQPGHIRLQPGSSVTDGYTLVRVQYVRCACKRRGAHAVCVLAAHHLAPVTVCQLAHGTYCLFGLAWHGDHVDRRTGERQVGGLVVGWVGRR